MSETCLRLLLAIGVIAIVIILFAAHSAQGAEAVCFVNNLPQLDVYAWAMTTKNDIQKERHMKPGEEACYVVDDGVRYIVKLEAIDYASEKQFGRKWRKLDFFGAGVYDIFIRGKYLQAERRP